MKSCPSCGQAVDEGSRFCSNCGQQFPSAGTGGGRVVQQAAPPPSAATPADPTPAGPPPPQMAPDYPRPTAPQRTNGSAIASLVLGILWLGGIGAILALVFGYRGKRSIDRSRGGEGGRGLALAGIVLGWIGVAGAIGVTLLVALAANSSDSAYDDSSAKSDARNMVSQVESCYTDTQDYSRCRTASDMPNTGLAFGSGHGQVEVSDATTDTFNVVAHSRSRTNFTITKEPSGAVQRSCDQPGSGGCLPDGTW
jgi:hypothetical protein